MMSYYHRFSWARFRGAVLQTFGVLWLLVEIFDYFLHDHAWIATIRSAWCLFVGTGLAVGAFRGRPKRDVEERIEGTDVVVQIRVGDILKCNGALIVGSNTTFDTSMDDHTIAADSVQGQFTDKYFRQNIVELDQKLDSALSSIPVGTTRTREDKPYGKLAEYQLGTVVPIQVGETKAYFVAMASLNAERGAGVDANAFQDALPRIWNGLRNRGGMEELLCPVLGAKYARLKLTRKELIQVIIRSFVAASREGKVTEKLTVVIRPGDIDKGHVSLDDLHRFLEYECVYAQVPRVADGGNPIGSPTQ